MVEPPPPGSTLVFPSPGKRLVVGYQLLHSNSLHKATQMNFLHINNEFGMIWRIASAIIVIAPQSMIFIKIHSYLLTHLHPLQAVRGAYQDGQLISSQFEVP